MCNLFVYYFDPHSYLLQQSSTLITPLSCRCEFNRNSDILQCSTLKFNSVQFYFCSTKLQKLLPQGTLMKSVLRR